MRTLALIMAVPCLSLGLAACGDTDNNSSSNEAEVHATLEDFKITLDESSATAGEVTFEVENDGPSTHEFVVVKTDLAPDALPTDDSGDVDEEGEGITAVDEIEDIEKGDSPKLTVDLEAGSYVVFCNLPGHYRQGMHAAFKTS